MPGRGRLRQVTALLAVLFVACSETATTAPATSAPAANVVATSSSTTIATTISSSSSIPSPTMRIGTTTTTAEPEAPTFAAEIRALDDSVLARTTWKPDCPVGAAELRHIVLAHWTPDGDVADGELVVHEDVADDIAAVFETIFDARFPIAKMRITSPEDLADPPSDDNNTTAFVCRPTVGGTGFSQHAYGLAVDINPLWNPYARDDLVLPPDAGPWLQRTPPQDGMLAEADPVVAAFDAIGWGWGGRWNSLVDWMHFSANGR